jgi:gallate decarboxylase subunit D
LSRSHVVLTRNAGSADLTVDAARVGKDLLVTLVGGKAHVGAVALGGFHRRSYASVLAVPNHRDDIIAKEAALRISKELRQSCVVVVGIHVHDASEGQVAEIVDASFSLVNELIEALK